MTATTITRPTLNDEPARYLAGDVIELTYDRHALLTGAFLARVTVTAVVTTATNNRYLHVAIQRPASTDGPAFTEHIAVEYAAIWAADLIRPSSR